MENEDHRQNQTRRMAAFYEEIQRAKTKTERLAMGDKYAAIAKEEGLDPDYFMGFAELQADIEENPPAPSIPFPAYVRTHAASNAMDSHRQYERPLFPVELYKPSNGKKDGKGLTLIPMETLNTRFKTKKALTPRKNEIVKFEEGQTNLQIPETFPFTYYQEAAIHGLLTLALKGKTEWTPKAEDQKLYVDIPELREFYEAVGLRPNTYDRHFRSEEQLRNAFLDLMTYRHPFVLSRRAGTDENGKELFEILAGLKPLFELFFHQKSGLEAFYIPGLKPKAGGGWLLDAELKNMRVYFNPSIFPADKLKSFRKLPSNIYRQVEETRTSLSLTEGKRRPWQEEAAFLSFVQYLLAQWGKPLQMKNGKKIFVGMRELELFARKLGLGKRLKEDRRSTLRVIKRTLRIHRKIGLLYGYKWERTAGGKKIILYLYLDPEKLPHLRKRARRSFPASQSIAPVIQEAIGGTP
jgi:hypothetical protein